MKDTRSMPAAKVSARRTWAMPNKAANITKKATRNDMPVKIARTIDKGISKAKNVASKVNEAVMNKATKRYDKAINSYTSAVKAEKRAKWPAEKYVTTKRADVASRRVDREWDRWVATKNTYDKISNKLKGRK